MKGVRLGVQRTISHAGYCFRKVFYVSWRMKRSVQMKPIHRSAAHRRQWLVSLAALALMLHISGVSLTFAAPPTPVITTPTPQPTPTPEPLNLRNQWLLTPEAERRGAVVFLPLVASSARAAADINEAAFSYIVQPDDTLWSLALEFGRDLDTMSCVTTPLGADAEALTPGAIIVVPALADLCYTVRPGDTLASIAAAHGLTVADIVAVPWNGFTAPPYTVLPRQRVLLPGARAAAAPRPDRTAISVPSDRWAGTEYEDWPYGDGHFIWPVSGPISQGARPGHTAIDIVVPVGTPVRAADRGRVILAGWNPSGYGFRVVIDHGTDYVTLYAHLSDIYVEKGQVVGKGQVIGASGANGNITGPHLHFEIRDFGRLVDPLRLLP